ncbi:MAG: multicopper oxidase domain-containing protein [Chloroflexota bacterium]|nr:multicopper oxidase domain-containing protein [Chloroflexota bacterium]
MTHEGARALSRRAVICGFAAMGGGALLVACGGTEKAATANATVSATVSATTPAVTASPVPVATTVPTAAAGATSGTNTVNVILKEFSIAFDTAVVNAGMVTFLIKDSGTFSHNFNVKLDGKDMGIATIEPGASMTLTLDLKPGTYLCHCIIAGHEQLGMVGVLVVK